VKVAVLIWSEGTGDEEVSPWRGIEPDTVCIDTDTIGKRAEETGGFCVRGDYKAFTQAFLVLLLPSM